MYEYGVGGGEPNSYRGINKLIQFFGEKPVEYESLKERMLRLKLGIAENGHEG